MAIDRNRAAELIREIDALLDSTMGSLSEGTRAWIKEKVLDAAFEEIRDLIERSRPPILFLIGRSGHGKSSLVNALANKEVAAVGHIRPETAQSTLYVITFDEKYSAWDVVDSRGLFDTTRPLGASAKSAVEVLKQDLTKYNPDVILHVVAAPETRALEADMAALGEIETDYRRRGAHMLPAVAILTKADTLGDPMQWPPEHYPLKAGLVQEVVMYMANEVLHAGKTEPLDLNFRFRGYRLDSPGYSAVVPVCTLPTEPDRWNIEILSEYICEHLPKCAQLAFVQAQNRKALLRKLSSSLIKRFSQIAGVIGATPIPVSDIAVLVPLQTLMIATIGGLSCRTLSKETAAEYLGAAGINLSGAFAARELVRLLTEGIGPGPSALISGAMAAGVTLAIGKSAEAYFFEGAVKKPSSFLDPV